MPATDIRAGGWAMSVPKVCTVVVLPALSGQGSPRTPGITMQGDPPSTPTHGATTT
jgi:hypothetical protein